MFIWSFDPNGSFQKCHDFLIYRPKLFGSKDVDIPLKGGLSLPKTFEHNNGSNYHKVWCIL